MKITAIILALVSFSLINLVLLGLLSIGSISMASVEGVASPWMGKLFLSWFIYQVPYIIYLLSLLLDRQNRIIIFKCISYSTWIAFPGAIAFFIFYSSKIGWAAFIFPVIQTAVYLITYAINIKKPLASQV
jgi:hypothetical protein